MITIQLTKNKNVSQNSTISFTPADYESIIAKVSFHKLACTCGRKGNLVKHSFYKRSFKLITTIEEIRVLRVKCKSCGKTHALLPEWIVPYSQILLDDHVNIIKAHIKGNALTSLMEAKPVIDESNIQYLIKQFKMYWKERLIAYRVLLNKDLTKRCFQAFNRQFMQIKRTVNILFSINHITCFHT